MRNMPIMQKHNMVIKYITISLKIEKNSKFEWILPILVLFKRSILTL